MALDITANWNQWCDLAVLGIDAVCAAVLYTMYKKKERLIKNILEAPSLSVSSELEELLQGKEQVPYAVIRGRVRDMGQTIESSSGLKTVMQRVTLKEHSYRRSALNNWGDNVRTIHQAHNSVPFALRSMLDRERSISASAKKFLVRIDNPFDAEDESLFLTTSTNFTPSNSSVASTVMGFFTGVAVRGVERTEEVLPVDTVITGIGRLVKDPEGNIKLVTPKDDDQYRFILSTLPVESIVKKLEGRNTILKVAICVVVSVGAVIAVRRLRLLWQEYQMQRMRDAILRQRSQVDIEGLAEIQICTVCLTNPKEVILLNCGHVCVCADCVLKIGSKCPVCRSPVLSTHPAFIVIASLEPGLVMHMTAAIMVFMVVQDFMLEKACRVNLGYGDAVCDALKAKNAGDKYATEEKEVQKLISSVMVYRTLLENAFPMVLVFLIGAWSDKYGRKLPMLLVIGAFLVQNVLLIGCVFLEKATGAWSVAVVSSLIASLSGNQACFMVAVFSYVSDNTVVEKRTMRTGIAHCCIFLGVTLGLAGGGALSHSGLPFATCFLLGVGLEAVSLIYLWVMMENQPQPGATKGKSWSQIIGELFDFKHIKDAWTSVMRPREDGARMKLWLLLVAHACALMPMMGEMGVCYLFTRLQFDWDGGAFGKWMTYKTVIGFLSNFLSMAVLTSFLKMSDAGTGIVAALGNLISSLVFTFATSPFLMYLAPLGTLLSGGGMVVPRATISKIVPTSELGKINSFIGSLESIIPLVASSLYTGVYTRYLDILPGSFFLISAAVAVPPIFIYSWFLSQDKPKKKDDKKKK